MSISGFGATGPYADYQWDDIVVQAMSGSLLPQKPPEAGPVRLPGSLGLHFIGSIAALGALAAVLVAEATGCGSFVDCAAIEALSTTPARATYLLSYQYRGGARAAPWQRHQRHADPVGRLPLRRRLHGHDVDAPAAP